MAIVYIALGSNIENRTKNIRRAMDSLEQGHVQVHKCSTLLETDPVGGPAGQGKYLNGVLKASTDLNPLDLLNILKQIEQRLGRIKTVRNGPRLIDLDILLYDQIIINTPQLTIPHPRMLERDFVMRPLKEIEPELAKELMSCA